MMSEALPPSLPHTLPEGDAHVWSIAPSAVTAAASGCLSRGEVARAGSIRDTAARARFVLSRGALRHILARYAGIPAASLQVATAAHGKPVLDPSLHLHFSLSHSRDITLVAVARTPIGIDVEQMRPVRHLERTASRLLHPSTCELLARLPPHRRAAVFLRAWTEREAHVKAVGGGLFRTPDSLPFSGDDDAAAGHVRHVRDRVEGSLWSVARIDAGAHAVAAVAALGEINRLSFFSWNCDVMEADDG